MTNPTLFEQILSTNLVNFIIVVSTLVLIYKKAHLGDLIQKMADDVKLNIEKTRINVRNASRECKEANKEIEKIPAFIEEVRYTTQQNAKSLKEKIEITTNKQENEIRENLERVYRSQNEKAKKLTVKEIYLACVDLAQKEIIARLDEKMHRKLIKTSINEIEKIEGNLS